MHHSAQPPISLLISPHCFFLSLAYLLTYFFLVKVVLVGLTPLRPCSARALLARRERSSRTNMHGDASAEFIAIISRQRSSSTMLSQAIAAHPCVAWANEIFHVAPAARLRRECGTQDRFSGRLLREHGKAALHASRFKHPVAFLRAVRELQLTVQWPKCGCKRASYAVVFKLFDRHLHGRLHESGLQDLLANPRTAVVVLEREAAGSECSLSWAKHSADWCVLRLGRALALRTPAGLSHFCLSQGRTTCKTLGRLRYLQGGPVRSHALSQLSGSAHGVVRPRARVAP